MAVVSVVNVAAATGGGNQSITLNLGGLTPKFVIFKVSYAAALSTTPTNHSTLSYGWTDGTRQAAIGLSAENGVSKTDTASSNVTSALIYCMAPNNGTADGVASFVSWTANQVTINWDTTPGAAFRIQVFAIAGSDFSVRVDSNSDAQTVDVPIDITAPAFEPSTVLMMTEGGTLNSTNNATYLVSFGFANNDGGGAVSQCSHSIRNPDNSSITTPSGHTSSLYAAATIASTGAVVTGYEVGSFDANGFSVTPRAAAGNFFMYAALKFDNQSTWVGVLDSPTATGNQSVTAPGFTPMARMQLLNASAAVDTGDTTNATALYISTVGDDEFTTGISDEDGVVGGTDTQSVAVNQAIHLDDDAGVSLKDATFVSWDANGWTDNYSLANGGVRKWPSWAVEEESAGTTDAALDVNASGSATFEPNIEVAADLDVNAAASATFESSISVSADLDVNAISSLTFEGEGRIDASLDANATASVTFVGVVISTAAIDSSATSTVTFEADSTVSTEVDINAAASVTFVAEATVDSDFDLDAIGSATFTGSATVDADLDSDAAASVTFVGEDAGATVNGTLQSDAAASVTFVGAIQVDVVLSSDAVASATFTGEAQVDAEVSVPATSSVTFVGEDAGGQVDADFNLASTSTVTFTGESTVSSDATLTAIATATFESAISIEGAFSIDAVGLVEFVGEDASAPVAPTSSVRPPLPEGGGAKSGRRLRKYIEEDEELMDMIAMALPHLVDAYRRRNE